MSAYTFDTGALIALERNRQRAVAFLKLARTDGARAVVPSVCVGEWWRGRTDVRERILAAVVVEHTDDDLVKVAGEALAAVPKASCIDAIVMATAARYGGIVVTSDVHDLFQLQTAFPDVRVLRV
jgi:predicted nucleic acid-binding protein